tara:strand:- start:734 stop:1375 length:642 start_codon:yes stop_codon:yes gene_type:complete
MKNEGFKMNMKLPVNDVKFVNDKVSKYWNKNENELKAYFHNKLMGVKGEYEAALNNPYDKNVFEKHYSNGDVENNTGKFRSFLRLPLGYNALVLPLNKTNVGFELFSEAAYELKVARKIGKKLTKDHIFGVTEVGVHIFMVFMNSGWDWRYMCDEWLPNNLELFFTCRILKSEHQKEDEDDDNGVARGEHTLEQKMLLQHYTEVGIPLPLIAD